MSRLIGLHKEKSLKARLELFATNITVLEMRWHACSKSGVHTARRGNCADLMMMMMMMMNNV